MEVVHIDARVRIQVSAVRVSEVSASVEIRRGWVVGNVLCAQLVGWPGHGARKGRAQNRPFLEGFCVLH